MTLPVGMPSRRPRHGQCASALQRESTVRFVASAFLGLLAWWLGDNPHLAAAEIDRRFRQLAVPALHAAARDR